MRRGKLTLALAVCCVLARDASANEPPAAVIKSNPPADAAGVISGASPLPVGFNTCQTRDADDGDELKSFFDFDADGEWDEIGFCRQRHVYKTSNPRGRCTGARACVWDRQPLEGHFVCRAFEVCVTQSSAPRPTTSFYATGWDEANSNLYLLDTPGASISTIGLLGAGGGTGLCDDLATDPSGQLWFNSNAGGYLYRVNPSTGGVTGGPPTIPTICGLAISSKGIAYTSPSINGGLATIDLVTGVQTRLQATSSTHFFSGLAFDHTETLYGVDAFANELVVLDTETGEATVIGSLGRAGTDAPLAIAFDANGDLWLTQFSGLGQSTLYLVDPVTAGKTLVRSGLPMLTGLARMR